MTEETTTEVKPKRTAPKTVSVVVNPGCGIWVPDPSGRRKMGVRKNEGEVLEVDAKKGKVWLQRGLVSLYTED